MFSVLTTKARLPGYTYNHTVYALEHTLTNKERHNSTQGRLQKHCSRCSQKGLYMHTASNATKPSGSNRAPMQLSGAHKLTCRSSFARLTAMTPAEQPMPARLYDTMLERILKWLMIMADREGVGLKRLQLTTKISICRQQSGLSPYSKECARLQTT